MPVIYKNGQVYGSDEWRSDINTFRSQIDSVTGITKSYTIGPSDWADGVYTINDPLITVGTNESTQIIGYPSENYSDELYYMLANANIRILSVTNGQIKLKAMGILPTNPLPIIITYRVGASPITLTMDSTPTNGSNNPITSDGVYHAINDLNTNIYVAKNTSPALEYNTSVVVSDNNYGIALNINRALHLCTVRLNIPTSVALSSNTEYTVATIPDTIINWVGHTDIAGVGMIANANTTVEVHWKTWDTDNMITVKPRAGVTKGHWINAAFTFQF